MASHTVGEVKLGQHVEWLKANVQTENRKLYVAEESGTFVGTVRADFENEIYELSWTVAPEARGQGIGKRLVDLLANRIKGTIRAEVKNSNAA